MKNKAIRWSTDPEKEWAEMTDEEKQIFIEMATPTAEIITQAIAATVPVLQSFLDAAIKESEAIIARTAA